MGTLDRWTGSAWTAAANVKRWTGSAWSAAGFVKRWNGSSWVLVWGTPIALTAFLSSTASTTLPSAQKLLTSAPSSGTLKVTTVTGSSSSTFGEICSQTRSVAVATSMSETGYGFLLDSTVLEGTTLQAGSATISIKIAAGVAGLSTTVHVRLFKRSSAGGYTQLMDATKAWVTTITGAVLTGFSSTTITASDFATGDKLYMDCWINAVSAITTHSPYYMYENGGAAQEIVTAGYL